MSVPAYPHRVGWTPKCVDDFGGGGAYPEIHVAQFPAGQQPLRKRGVVALPPTTGSVVVKETTRPDNVEVLKPGSDQVLALKEETAAALEELKRKKETKNQLVKVESSLKTKDKYFRYIPDEEAPGYNPNIKERIIRVVEKAMDPLEPPKFRNMARFNTQSRAEEPVPILRAPPTKLTAEERKKWEVPPCISNWINPSGHTLPLEMRIQATRRGNETVEINPKLAAFSEALQVAEKAAREELKLKQDLRKQQLLEEEKAREDRLRELAAEARAEKAALLLKPEQAQAPAEEGVKEEEEMLSQLEKDRRREIIREYRIQRARDQKNKRPRLVDRDISDKVVLARP